MALTQPEKAQLEEELRASIARYYTTYYRDTLTLPDWQRRVELRQDEVESYGGALVGQIMEWLNYDFAGKDVLVVGAGTGSEAFAFQARGALVHGVEPNLDALAILHLRARLTSTSTENFVAEYAEDLPYPDNSFDFVCCYSVLEHVHDVERSLDEMIRVCRSGGWIYINTPDYRFPYEGHYKLWMLPFAPRWIWGVALRLKGYNPAFLSTLQFVTTPQINRIVWKRPVTTFRAQPSMMYRGYARRRERLFVEFFGITRSQFVFLKKHAQEGAQ